jgi:hypothetical protein
VFNNHAVELSFNFILTLTTLLFVRYHRFYETQRLLIIIMLEFRMFYVRFQVLTAASMMFRIVFWDVLPCKIIVNRRFLMMEAVHTSEMSVDNYFTRQYIPEDNSEHQ